MKHVTSWLLPSLVHPDRHSRNGSLPSAAALRRIAHGYNFIACAQRKLVICRAEQFGIAGGGGWSATGRAWPFYFRTGIGTDSLYVYLGVSQTQVVHASPPRLEIEIVRASDGVVVNLSGEGVLEFDGLTASDATPDDVSHVRLVIHGLAGDTEYHCFPQHSNGIVFHYLMAHEAIERHADDSKAGIVRASRYVAEGPIEDADLSDLDDAGNRHWRCSGSQLLSWGANSDAASTGPEITSTSYADVLYSVAPRTLRLATQYHGTQLRPNLIPVKMAARLVRKAGAGNGALRIFDGANAIEVSAVLGASSSWFTATGMLSGNPADWQLQGKKTGTATMAVYGVSLFEYSPPWPSTDGPSAIYIPETQIDFIRLGLAVPDALWLCQDASGNLAPTIGNVELVPTGSGHLYQQTVAGWARKFVGFPEGGLSRFGAAGEFDLAAGESMAVVMLGSVSTASVTPRWALQGQGITNGITIATSGVPSTRHNNLDTAMAGVHGGTTVRPWVWYRRADINESGAKTDLGQWIATHNESASAGQVTCIGASGTSQVSASLRCTWFAVYKGANAERDWKAYLQGLGYALPY